MVKDLRGVAARTMVAQDARWIANVMLSANAPGFSAIPLLFTGHISRVCYEGSVLLRSSSAGVPGLASLLPAAESAIMVRARHSTKFLDDKKIAVDSLLGELSGFRESSISEFLGKSHPIARAFEADLGLYFSNGHLLGGTIPLQFKAGFPAEIGLSNLGSAMYEMSVEQGSILAVLAAAMGDRVSLRSTGLYESMSVQSKDKRSSKYLERRYDRDFPIGAKLMLLLMEGELGTASEILPLTPPSQRESAFRARVVTLFHVLRGLRRIVDKYPGARGLGTQAVITLLKDPAIVRHLDADEFRRLRNRSVHYEISDPAFPLTLSAPMFGIVETVYGQSFESLDLEFSELIVRTSQVLSRWMA